MNVRLRTVIASIVEIWDWPIFLHASVRCATAMIWLSDARPAAATGACHNMTIRNRRRSEKAGRYHMPALMSGTTGLRPKIMRLVLAIVLLALSNIAGAATQSDLLDLQPNPEWCRPGYRCLQLKDYASMTLMYVKTQDERDALRLRVKAGRSLRMHLTCGLGVAGVIDTDYNAKLLPAGYCGLGWGW